MSSFFMALLLSACGSVPEKTVSREVHGTFESNSSDEEENEGVAINVDLQNQKRNKNYQFFSRIDEQTMKLIEDGSPDSLRKAYLELKSQEESSDEQSKVLFNVENSIMQMVWPSDKINMDVPEVSSQNAYIGAISSAKNQIYDMSTGNGDFLALVLPSLLVTQTDDVSSFFENSKNSLNQALKINPDSTLANYLLARLYCKHGDHKSEFQFAKKAWNGASENLEACYSYAQCLYENEKFNDAKLVVDAAMIRFPQSVPLIKLKSKVYFSLGDYATAEDSINRVLQKEPNDLASFLFRAKILVEKEDYIHAASLLDVYARQDDSSREYLLLRARIQLDWSHNIPAVLETLTQALTRYPEDKETLLFAAKVSSSTGMKINGMSTDDFAEAVLKIDPENKSAVSYAIEGLVQNKKWDSAYKYSLEFVKSPDVSRQMLFNHIEICLALGKNDEAWNMVLPLYKKDPKDDEVLQSYLNVLSKTGRGQEALSLINSLLPSSATKMKSFLYYRRSALQSKESDKLSDLRSSIIANPRNSDALFSLYEIYFSKKDYRKAQYYLKQVAALKPNDSEILALNENLSRLLK